MRGGRLFSYSFARGRETALGVRGRPYLGALLFIGEAPWWLSSWCWWCFWSLRRSPSKSGAIARTVPVALALAPPLRGFYLATKPLVDVFNWLGNLVLRPFGIPPASEAGHAPHSEDELRTLLRESREGGLIQGEEQRLSDAALVFGDRRAREVMTPRSEIDFVTTDRTPREAAELAMTGGHTRLPLSEPDRGLEGTIGFVNAKDLLRVAFGAAEDDLRELARPIARVAESTRLDEVLREMRHDRRHMALVLDEHGTVVGLITIEDILEELVGEIEDEFDPRERELIRPEDGSLWIDGSAPVRMVAERLRVPDESPHEATIGGHLIEVLGRVPEEGEVVHFGRAPLEVAEVDDTRIVALRGRSEFLNQVDREDRVLSSRHAGDRRPPAPLARAAARPARRALRGAAAAPARHRLGARGRRRARRAVRPARA